PIYEKKQTPQFLSPRRPSEDHRSRGIRVALTSGGAIDRPSLNAMIIATRSRLRAVRARRKSVKLAKNGDKNCHPDSKLKETAMKQNNNEAGFSLIELLIVVVIIGVVAALAVPNLQKGLRAAENGTAFATMRTISSSQAGFFSQKN